MGKELGGFVVLFRPGVITGVHNEREVVLREICHRLGGFDCKIFDPYLVYSGLADEGLLVRIEQCNVYGFYAVSFFYPAGEKEREIRKMLINRMLDEVRHSPGLIKNGYVVLSDAHGNLKLGYINNRGGKGEKSAALGVI